jgi:hypothetical protein
LDNRFLESFLNQTTLDLRKEKWTFLNQEFTVSSNLSSNILWFHCAYPNLHALCVNLPDFHGLNLVIFSKFKIGENEKITFFNSIIFCFIVNEISHKVWSSMDGTQFL